MDQKISFLTTNRMSKVRLSSGLHMPTSFLAGERIPQPDGSALGNSDVPFCLFGMGFYLSEAVWIVGEGLVVTGIDLDCENGGVGTRWGCSQQGLTTRTSPNSLTGLR